MYEHFKKLCDNICYRGNAETEYKFLHNAYCEPTRYYHNLRHIETCLNDLRDVWAIINTPHIIEIAIWYHDVIYIIGQSDNELKSADAAVSFCSQCDLTPQDIAEVKNLILATKHDKSPQTANQEIIIDIDLAILGKPPAQYNIYEQAIRKEYCSIPEKIFRDGRTNILKNFLARNSIFSNAYFINKYEKQARINLANAIANLSDGSFSG